MQLLSSACSDILLAHNIWEYLLTDLTLCQKVWYGTCASTSPSLRCSSEAAIRGFGSTLKLCFCLLAEMGLVQWGLAIHVIESRDLKAAFAKDSIVVEQRDGGRMEESERGDKSSV